MKKIIIDANKRRLTLNLRELFSYKDLFLIFAYRDYRVRYAQTMLGLIWAFLNPMATLLIFILVFSKAAGVSTGSIPYPLFAICGMSAWTYFSVVMSQSGSSIIAAQGMVQKIFFPRLIIPLSKALVGLIDFGITFLFIIGLLIYYHFVPSVHIVFLPLFILMTILSALGVGVWLSALTIRYRDFQHIIPFMVQFGLYITPTAYPSEILIRSLPKWATSIYYLNPMAGVIDGFRWSILGGNPPGFFAYISFTIVIVLFISSLFYFKRIERVMADIV